MNALTCRQLVVRYGDHPVLDGVDLEVAPEETVAILGPSGSGKTTLLYAVAGFIDPTSGEITIDERRVVADGRVVPPEDRDVGVVFQHYALWPHLDALDTVAYPLRRRGVAATEARRRAAELLELVGIGELAHRRPAQLSGGQQQRVGVARALARAASLYLFDEPTAHLDAPLRAALQDEIARLRVEVGAAAVYATHDAAEALGIADRVGLLRAGRLVQVGSPRDVYERPVDRSAADLTGPASVVSAAVVGAGNGAVTVRCGDVSVDVRADGPAVAGERVDLLVRPEWAQLGGELPGTVVGSTYRGTHTDHTLDTPMGRVLVRDDGTAAPRPGGGWTLRRVWPLPPSVR